MIRTRQRCRLCPSPALTTISWGCSLMHDGTPPAIVERVCYVHTSCITKIQGPYGDESTLTLFCGEVKLSTRQMQSESLDKAGVSLPLMAIASCCCQVPAFVVALLQHRYISAGTASSGVQLRLAVFRMTWPIVSHSQQSDSSAWVWLFANMTLPAT